MSQEERLTLAKGRGSPQPGSPESSTVRRAPATDHDVTQLVGTRIEYNLSRVWRGGVVASAIKKEGYEGWVNVVR